MKKLFLSLMVAFIFLGHSLSLHASTTIFTGSDSLSIDDTVALQSAVNQMASGDVLIVRGVSRISTVVISYRSGLTIDIEGIVTSIFDASPSSGGYSFSPSKNPIFSINGGSNITIESSQTGYLQNGYGEAIAAAGVTGLTLNANISGVGVGAWDAIYLLANSQVTVADCYIRKASQMLNTPDPSDPDGNGIKLYNNTGVVIRNVSISEMRLNGIYIGSGYDPSVNESSPNHYKNTVISGNHISGNGESGIQVNFNQPGGNPTRDFTIVGNSIWDNTADGIDLNNTSSPYNVWGLVQSNRLYHNGFIDGLETPDGSGVGTLISVNELQLSDNVAIDMNSTGLYAANASNVTFLHNLVIKNSNTIGNAADEECGNTSEACNSLSFSANDIYWLPGTSEQDSLRAFVQPSVSTSWSSNYVAGGNIEWVYGTTGTYYDSAAVAGALVPSPPAGLAISATNLSVPNFYRWSYSADGPALSLSDFVIATRSNPVTPRITLVAWTASSSHTVSINLGSYISVPSSPNEQVTVERIDGSEVIPSPILSNNILRIQLNSSPTFIVVP